jgi:hypothetical protein
MYKTVSVVKKEERRKKERYINIFLGQFDPCDSIQELPI